VFETKRNRRVATLRRIAVLAAGILAAVAVGRLLRRRRAARSAEPAAEVDPRSEELKRKLAVTREPVAPDPEQGPDADEARRLVHDEARATIEEMRRAEGAPSDATDQSSK
jgi:hypothetical protein